MSCRLRGLRSLHRPAAIASPVLVLMLLVLSSPAAACPVCYGETDSAVIDGVRWSVLFLGLLVYGVILGGGFLVWAVIRKARSRQGGPRTGDLRPLDGQGQEA